MSCFSIKVRICKTNLLSWTLERSNLLSTGANWVSKVHKTGRCWWLLAKSQGESNPTTPMGDPRWWKSLHAIPALGSGPVKSLGPSARERIFVWSIGRRHSRQTCRCRPRHRVGCTPFRHNAPGHPMTKVVMVQERVPRSCNLYAVSLAGSMPFAAPALQLACPTLATPAGWIPSGLLRSTSGLRADIWRADHGNARRADQAPHGIDQTSWIPSKKEEKCGGTDLLHHSPSTSFPEAGWAERAQTLLRRCHQPVQEPSACFSLLRCLNHSGEHLQGGWINCVPVGFVAPVIPRPSSKALSLGQGGGVAPLSLVWFSTREFLGL